MAVEERAAALTADVTVTMSWGELLAVRVELDRAIARNREHGAPTLALERALKAVSEGLFRSLSK